MSDNIRSFEGGKVLASVATTENSGQYLEIDENGFILNVPRDVKGFHLAVGVRKNLRAFVSMRDVGRNDEDHRGKYFTDAITALGGSRKLNVNWHILSEPIQVQRNANGNVWTPWHIKQEEGPSNRVDVWMLDDDSQIALYQVFVFTHDDGRTWRLYGEFRWKGQLFSKADKLVAKPECPQFGPFATWETVLVHPEFIRLLDDIAVADWFGTDDNLDPPLPYKDGELKANEVIVQWYIPGAEQKGLGFGWDHEDKAVVIYGQNLRVQAGPDGIKRLYRGDKLRYANRKPAKQPNKPDTILGVMLVDRPW